MRYSKKKSIVLVAMLLILSLCFLAGCNPGKTGGNPGSDIDSKPPADTFKIIEDKAKSIEYEEFDNGYVKMDIPKGWKFVAHPQADTVHYTFQVVNPENKDYQIYFGMKSEGFLSTEKERQWYASLYQTSPLAQYPAIDPQNTEGFFRVFSQASAVDGPVVGDFVFPTINDFTVLETLGNAPVGGDIVRGSYKNDNGDPIEGIFTATPKKVSLYYVNAVSVYNIVFFTAPADELVNWIDVLNHCVSTITFSDSFVQAFYNQEKGIAQSSAEIARINNETSNIITQGWANRQSSYDIISQKQSDATLGYERVYDTETNEIYKAYNGFTDDYTGSKYQAVTDDMYSSQISGYIEK